MKTETHRKTFSNREMRISTASLPDIVFMLLFFFMVTAVLRSSASGLRVRLPEAEECTVLQGKSSTATLYIGKSLNAGDNEIEKIQMDDAIIPLDQVGDKILLFRENLDETSRPKMMVSLKADQDSPMGLVGDVKQQLRKASALKINYSAIDTDGVYNW